MKNFNCKGHCGCPDCDGQQKPVVEIRNSVITKNDKLVSPENGIVFITEGRVILKVYGVAERAVPQGHFFFIRQGERVQYQSEAGSRALIVRLRGRLRFCPGTDLEQLYQELYRREEKMESQESMEREKSTENGREGILETNEALQLLLRGMEEAIRHGIVCRHYFEVKVEEMFFLFKVSYRPEELQQLFAPVLSPDTIFSQQIYTTFRNFRTVAEFASSMHMTPKQFTRRFNRVFGISPYLWMTRQKIRMIHQDILEGSKDNTQIADEYGFASTSQFYDYCRNNLGRSPKEIRNSNNDIHSLII